MRQQVTQGLRGQTFQAPESGFSALPPVSLASAATLPSELKTGWGRDTAGRMSPVVSNWSSPKIFDEICHSHLLLDVRMSKYDSYQTPTAAGPFGLHEGFSGTASHAVLPRGPDTLHFGGEATGP